MKISFTYSSGLFVSGQCILEIEDGKEMLSSINLGDDVTDDDFKNMNVEPNARNLLHTSSIEISYPIVFSCAESFYRNISDADVQIKRMNQRVENNDR